MALKGQTVTSTPTALANISANQFYSMQPPSGSRLFFKVDTSAPVAGSSPRVEVPGPKYGLAKAASGESIYVWHSEARQDFVLAYEEAD